MTLLGLPEYGGFFVLLSMYLTATSFIYLRQHKRGKMNKENFLVYSCSLYTFVLTAFYLVFEILRDGEELSMNSKFSCVSIPLLYKLCITVIKFFGCLIFVHRYVRINQIKLLAAPKKFKILPAMYVFVSIAYFIGHIIPGAIIQASTNRDKCNYEKLFVNVSGFSYFSGACFVLKTILQTVILVEIIKPMYKQYLKSTNSTSLNRILRKTLNRVVCCAIILTVGDIGVIIAYYTTVNNSIKPGPLLFIIYLFVDVLSLVCSYNDCGKRLFPFKSIFKTKENEESSQSLNTKVDEKSPKSQVNCGVDAFTLTREVQVNCPLQSSIEVLDETHYYNI